MDNNEDFNNNNFFSVNNNNFFDITNVEIPIDNENNKIELYIL